MTPSLGAFTLVALVLVITPGPDFAVIVPNAFRGRGVMTAIGTASGLAVHAAIAVAGLSAIVLASDVAFAIVKYLGAAFLVFLGVQAIIKSRTHGHAPAQTRGAPPRPLSRTKAFRQGFLVNVMNPKAPLLYLSIMPQFITTGSSSTAQLLTMSAILVALALLWYCALSALVHRLRPLLERFKAWIDRGTGVVLIALGVRVALESRPS